MIILKEVAEKLNNIFNNSDSEVQIDNPIPLLFMVATEGFHLDQISDRAKGKNFIPVFISSMGGEFNPVKGLKQSSYSIPMVFYFPVRFKDDFFRFGEFLEDVFVGSILNYGTLSGRAISNISVPRFGEIQNLDLKEFKDWVDSIYKKEIEIREPYMSMEISLFLTTAKEGLVYGNDVTADFSFTYQETTLTLEGIAFDGGSLQSNSQTQNEQEEGTNEGCGVPFGTSYGASFKIYPDLSLQAKESTTENKIYFFKELLKVWIDGNIQAVECQLTFKIGTDANLTYTRKCFIPSIMVPIEKGQLLSMTITFQKKVQDEEVGGE